MPDSDHTLPADLIEEVGRFHALIGIARLIWPDPLRRLPGGLVLMVRVLFA